MLREGSGTHDKQPGVRASSHRSGKDCSGSIGGNSNDDGLAQIAESLGLFLGRGRGRWPMVKLNKQGAVCPKGLPKFCLSSKRRSPFYNKQIVRDN